MGENRRIGPRQRVSVPETVHARVFDGEVVILDLGAGEYFSLDPIGSLAWGELAAGRCAEEIATEIARQYEVEFDRALSDLLAIVDELVSTGLLIPEPVASP